MNEVKSNKKIKANTKLRRFAVPTHRVTLEELLDLLLFQTTTYAEMLSPLAFFAMGGYDDRTLRMRKKRRE